VPIFKDFFRANEKVAKKFEKYLLKLNPSVNPFEDFEKIVTIYLHKMKTPVILDIGGGAKCWFNQYRPQGSKLICMDISQEQLDLNMDADIIVCADVTKEIPLPEGSVDLVVSRTVMEHLVSPKNFLKNSFTVLKTGGYAIHFFPCKLALFSIINQMLPKSIGRKILFSLKPDAREGSGFPAFYRQCYYSGIKRLLLNCGFEIKDIRHYHYQSSYFYFFLPLYLLSVFYWILTSRVKNLAAYLIIVAQKP
jgi:SAM-dependent methyltransferase